ncbi:Thioredoxin [Desulfonema limicola]|uniref:Thioredoxin n=1 Tax=Desulfonema limicola TaxID=45656 RepID=A0A975BAN5_9BACT|nr:thioredoxin TrxC [Desulfonema limicola]QTA81832.1 Thioredoxin [Desulfonema limicola]
MTQADSFIMHCPQCKIRNRIPKEKVGAVAKCGKCGQDIDTDILNIGSPVIITDKDFYDQIINSPLPAILDCWAPWCGPCQMMGPFMDELAADWKGKIRVGKMNVDENPKTSAQYQIHSIPTLLIFNKGSLVNSLTGALPKNNIIQAMSPFL